MIWLTRTYACERSESYCVPQEKGSKSGHKFSRRCRRRIVRYCLNNNVLLRERTQEPGLGKALPNKDGPVGYSPNREIRATGRYLLLLRRQFPYMSFFALAPRTLSDLQTGMLSKQSSSASFLPKADKTKGRHQAKDHARYAARFFVDLTPALKQTMPKAEHCVLQDVAIETRGHPVCFFPPLQDDNGTQKSSSGATAFPYCCRGSSPSPQSRRRRWA